MTNQQCYDRSQRSICSQHISNDKDMLTNKDKYKPEKKNKTQKSNHKDFYIVVNQSTQL